MGGVMKFLMVVAVIGIVIAVFVHREEAPSTAQTTPQAKNQNSTGATKTLLPQWPPVTDQAVAISNDLMARNYYVVLDGSGSMNYSACSGSQSKMAVAKAALSVFAKSVPGDANLGLQVFDGKGLRELLPLGAGNRAQFVKLVQNVVAGGGTPLLDSVNQAYNKLLEQGKKQLGYGEYHLVIVTDGEANTGQDPTPTVNKLLHESPVVLHTIGFCIGNDHSLNQAGRVLYQAADNPEALSQGLADVLAEAPQFTVSKFK